MKKFFYRVGDNENIFSVARRFGVSPTSLIKDNGLVREVRSGDVLFIKETGGRTYAVRPYDTLESVAHRFGVDAENIAAANGVDYIFYGLTIIIPE